MKNQSYFQTMAGTTYLCNSHKSMTLDDDVTMNIKYATINPFEYVYQRHNVSNSDIPPGMEGGYCIGGMHLPIH